MNESIHSNDRSNGSVSVGGAGAESARIAGIYTVQCHDADGNLVWEDKVPNLVTDVGANDMLNNELSGSGYTAAWYLGLISSTGYTTGPAAGDTASSHSGWDEDQNYSQSTRPAASWNAASARSKTLSSGAVFTMNASTTIKGCFLISNSTKGGATGVLFSAGLFSGGDQPVVSSNTLTVSYTATLT